MSYYRPASLLALGLTLACRGPVEVLDDGKCQQTYEFGNSGCAAIGGRVLGTGGVPLAAMSVVTLPGPAATSAHFAGYHTLSDTAGQFRIRVIRYVPPLTAVVPDTVSLYVRASVIRQPGGPPGPRDSALVRIELVPVGQIPKTADVELRLQYP